MHTRGGIDVPLQQGTARSIREPNRSTSHTREIADWVAAHYPATIGGSTVYRLI
jgi:hypothetical protein